MAEQPHDVPAPEEYQPPTIIRLGSLEDVTGAEGDSLTVDGG